MDHPYLNEVARIESLFAFRLLNFDLCDGVEDILQAVAKRPHRGTASRRIPSRRCGLRPSSVTKSTRQHSKSCKSSSNPPRLNNEQPGFVRTSKSTSLSPRLSPR